MMKMKQLFFKTAPTVTLGIVLGALLAGCTMIPKYERPDMPVKDQWNGSASADSPASKLDPELAADLRWMDFYISPKLQEVIQLALDNNRDLRMAALRVESTRELYRVKRSELLPAVNAGAGMTRQQFTAAQSQGNPLFGGASRSFIIPTYTANLVSTSFELDLFGRLRSQNKAALERYFATEAAKDAMRISLIAEVANAYLQWVSDQQILDLAESSLAAREQSFNLVRESLQSGVASELDLSSSQVGLENEKANIALFKRLVELDQNALNLLIGSTDSTSILNLKNESDTPFVEMVSLENLPIGLPSETLLTRPDIREVENRLKSANADIGAARAAFFPRITLTGSYGYASTDLSGLFSSTAAGAWTFAPQVTLPIFQAGRNFANLKYSKAQKEIMVAEYEKAIQTAFKEVADELAIRKTIGDELDARLGLVEANETSYRIYKSRYEAGIDSLTTLLDAQTLMLNAQQQAITVQKQQVTNLINLYKALGGGVEIPTTVAQNTKEN